MEGLPSKLWRPYLQHYLYSQHSAKSPKRLLTRILKTTHTLAWSQWDHRNKIVHGVGNMRDKTALALLRSNIIYEFLLGPANLPPADHNHFTHCLHSLLTRTANYQKHWYLNVTAARRRHLRRQGMADEDRAAALANSKIIQWIRTGRLR
jgi:hypothetical protein